MFAFISHPDSVESIRSFLKGRKIAMSDTVAECSRRRPTALDTGLTDIRLVQPISPFPKTVSTWRRDTGMRASKALSRRLKLIITGVFLPYLAVDAHP